MKALVTIEIASITPHFSENPDYTVHLDKIATLALTKAQKIANLSNIQLRKPILIRELDTKIDMPNIISSQDILSQDEIDSLLCGTESLSYTASNDEEKEKESEIELVDSSRTITIRYKYIYEIK